MTRVSVKGKTCQEPNCTNPVLARSYCRPHYMLLVRNPRMTCRVDGCTSRAKSMKSKLCHRHSKSPATPAKPGNLDKYLILIGELAVENDRLREEKQTLLFLLSQQVSTQTLASECEAHTVSHR